MKSDAANAAHDALVKCGVNFVACLPDSAFQELYLPLSAENTGFTFGTYALLRGPMAFGVPMLLLISHRGDLGDERWFSVPFGWGTKPLLDSMRITHRTVEKTEEVSGAIAGAVKSMNSMQAPVAILFAGEILF